MIFGRMIKADAAQRRIYARLDETPDRSRMALDYARSKPHFEAWSDSMRKASDGKNLGNVRVQHSLGVAGLVEQIDFDDDAKAIDFMIKVTNDQVWNDVEQGIYTGISQGGRYGARWNDGVVTRYEAIPEELSLVDRPCNPNATFKMLKAAGGEEERKFNAGDTLGRISDALIAAGSRAEQRGVLMALPALMLKAVFNTDDMRAVAEAGGLQKRDYSTEEREALAKKGEAREDGSYPIVDKDDLDNAIEAFGRAKDKEMVKAWITKRAKALGATDALPHDWEGSTKKKSGGDMKKGIGDVAQMANLLEQLKWLACCVTADATAERDGSPLPARLAGWLSEGVTIFNDLAAEETKEALTALQASVEAIPAQVMAKAAEALDMIKAGARHSKEDLARVQSIHDTARELGADCGGHDGEPGMMKAALELGRTRDEMKKLAGDLSAARAEIVELKKQPASGGPARHAIARTEDNGNGGGPAAVAEIPAHITAMPEGIEKTTALTRWSMENPQPPSAPRRLA